MRKLQMISSLFLAVITLCFAGCFAHSGESKIVKDFAADNRLTKIDVLNNYEELPVCTAYKIDGQTTKYFPASIAKLGRAEPVYTKLKGWKGWNDTEAVVKGGWDELPPEMKDYINFIEKETGVRADLISIGADRDETIDRRQNWWN